VVADERQAALKDAALLDVGDLRREVVALDAVGVVQEVQRVVDRQAEAGAPRDEPLVDLGRDADLGDLVEDLRRDRQQPDEGGPRPRAEHDLEAALEREDLGVEARTRDHVGQEVLDVVERPWLRDRVLEVADLLLGQELLFVVEHGADRSTRARSLSPCLAGPPGQTAIGGLGGRSAGRITAGRSVGGRASRSMTAPMAAVGRSNGPKSPRMATWQARLSSVQPRKRSAPGLRRGADRSSSPGGCEGAAAYG